MLIFFNLFFLPHNFEYYVIEIDFQIKIDIGNIVNVCMTL